MKRKRYFSYAVILLAIALLVAGGVIAVRGSWRKAAAGFERYTVTRGDLGVYSVGGGRVTAVYNYAEAGTGTIVETAVSVGMNVSADQRLGVYLDTDGQRRTLYSQHTGVVTSINATSIVVSDPDLLQMTISVREKDIYRIAEGQSAQVYISALDKWFDAKVDTVSLYGSASGDSSVFTVSVRFERGEENIYLGMSGSARVLLEEKKDILKAPVGALIEEDGESYLLLSEWADAPAASRRQHYVKVTAGLSDGSFIEVTSADTELENREILIPAEGNSITSLINSMRRR